MANEKNVQIEEKSGQVDTKEQAKKAEDQGREKNKQAKDKLKSTIDNEKTGAEVFVTLLSSMAHEINEEVNKKTNKGSEKEKNKPRYRFWDTFDNNVAIGSATTIERRLNELNYYVTIYEDLELKDVSQGDRFFIRISNKSGVFIDINLLYYGEKIKDFEFNEVAYIENNLAKIEGSINTRVKILATYIADYIAYAMYSRDLFKLRYKKIGWEYYIKSNNEGEWIFKYDTIYTKRAKYDNNLIHIRGELPKSLSDGLEEVKNDSESKRSEWVSHTIKLMRHPHDCLILGAGISGLVRQLLPYTKETNININIQGESASGKSTICHYLLSIFGNPEKLEGSFIDTDNSIEETRAKRPILPYVLDERMLRVINEQDKNKEKIILMDIFREYEGKVRGRMGKQYEDESGNRIYGPVISSSVEEMTKYVLKSDDLGQYRRFIEFNIGAASDGLLFEDSKEANETERIAYKNYGLGISIIVDYMLRALNNNTVKDDKDISYEIINEPTIYRDRFKELTEIIEDELAEKEKEKNNAKVRGLQSSASRFALIVLSYQILRESLLYYTWNIIKEFDLSELGTNIKLGEEEIKGILRYQKDIGSFVKFSDRDDFIEDQTDDIIDKLIENLVNKLERVNKTPQDHRAYLYKYIIDNRQHFKEVEKFTKEELVKLRDSNGEYIGCCIVDKSKKSIKLYTLDKDFVHIFLGLEPLPEPEKIKQFIKDVHKNSKQNKIQAREYATNVCKMQINEYMGKRNNKAEIVFYGYNIDCSDSEETKSETKEGDK